MAEAQSTLSAYEKDIGEELKCNLCLDLYEDPRQLPCGHTFCLKCIIPLDENDENCIKCPKCRTSVRLPEGGAIELPKNFDKVQLLDIYNKYKKKNPEKCPEHDDPLKVYCETCHKAICGICIINDEHKNHRCLEISKCYPTHLQQLQESLEVVEHRLDDTDNAVKCLTTAMTEMEKQGVELKKAINIQAQEMINKIEQSRAQLLQQVNTAVQNKRPLLEKQREYADQKKSQLKTCQETVKKNLRECTELQILQTKDTITEEMKKALICTDQKAFKALVKADMEFIPKEVTEINIGYIKNSSTAVEALLSQSTAFCTLTLKSRGTCMAFPIPPSLISVRLSSPTMNRLPVQCDITQIHPGEYRIPFTPITRQDRLMVEMHAEGVDEHVSTCKYTFPLIPLPEMRHEQVEIITGVYQPSAIAIFDNNDIVVADTSCIRILNRKGEQVNSFHTCKPKGTKQIPLTNLNGVAISVDGHILATNGHRLLKLTTNGLLVKSFGKETKGNSKHEFNHPKGIASHPHTGKIFVADESNSRIQVFTKDLAWNNTIPQPGSKPLKQPYDVAVDNAGHLYVAEKGNNCITKLTTEGKYVTKFVNAQLSVPSSLAIHNNLVYVGNSRVLVFDSNGNLLHCLPRSERGCNRPRCIIAIDKSGVNLYVFDNIKKCNNCLLADPIIIFLACLIVFFK